MQRAQHGGSNTASVSAKSISGLPLKAQVIFDPYQAMSGGNCFTLEATVTLSRGKKIKVTTSLREAHTFVDGVEVPNFIKGWESDQATVDFSTLEGHITEYEANVILLILHTMRISNEDQDGLFARLINMMGSGHYSVSVKDGIQGHVDRILFMSKMHPLNNIEEGLKHPHADVQLMALSTPKTTTFVDNIYAKDGTRIRIVKSLGVEAEVISNVKRITRDFLNWTLVTRGHAFQHLPVGKLDVHNLAAAALGAVESVLNQRDLKQVLTERTLEGIAEGRFYLNITEGY